MFCISYPHTSVSHTSVVEGLLVVDCWLGLIPGPWDYASELFQLTAPPSVHSSQRSTQSAGLPELWCNMWFWLPPLHHPALLNFVIWGTWWTKMESPTKMKRCKMALSNYPKGKSNLNRHPLPSFSASFSQALHWSWYSVFSARVYTIPPVDWQTKMYIFVFHLKRSVLWSVGLYTFGDIFWTTSCFILLCEDRTKHRGHQNQIR